MRLDGVGAGLASADANDFGKRLNKDFAVADLAGFCRLSDGFYRLVHHVVGDCHFQLYFGKKIDNIFGTTVELGVAFLAAKAFYLGHSHALHPDVGQGVAHVVQAKRFNYSSDEFHDGFLRTDENPPGPTPEGCCVSANGTIWRPMYNIHRRIDSNHNLHKKSPAP